MTTAMPSRSLSPRGSAPRAGTPGSAPTTMRVDPFRVLRRYALTIVASGIVGCGLGVVAYFLLMRFFPLYSGTTFFEIKAGLEQPTQLAATDLTKDELVERLARTEAVLLTSRSVLDRAVQHPDVRRTQWFQNGFMDENDVPQYEDAIDELEEDLRAAPLRGSNLLSLSWSTHHPADVPVVLGRITQEYLDRRKEQDKDALLSSNQAFQRQLDESNQMLTDLSGEIQGFIRDKGISTLEDPRFSQTALQLNQVTQTITDTLQQLAYNRTALQQVSAKLQGTIEPDAQDRQFAEQDPEMIVHTRELQRLRAELRIARDKYEADHNEVRKYESEVRAFEAERDVRLEEIMTRNLEAQREQLTNEIGRYEQMIQDLDTKAVETQASLKELAAVQSEYNAKELRRQFLEATRDKQLALINEVEMMKLREDAKRVRVVEHAIEPREVAFPKLHIVVPLGGLLLLGLTVGLIFLREFTDQRVKTAADLALLPHAAVLGCVPELSEDPTNCQAAELVVRRQPHSVLAESYRQAYAPVARLMDLSGHQTLVLAGGLPGAGTTTAVTNLASAATAAGRSVLVVDANFRRPRLAELFGVEPEVRGLGDLLTGEASLDETIHESEHEISVIASGTPANRVFERLNNGRFDGLVAELRDRFDLIIFDAPPAVVAGDAMVLANKVDAAVLVVRAHREQRGLVGRLLGQFSQAQAELLGILLNRPRGTAGGYFRKNFAAMASYARADH